jgi:uncharacterized lipoprotein YajG
MGSSRKSTMRRIFIGLPAFLLFGCASGQTMTRQAEPAALKLSSLLYLIDRQGRIRYAHIGEGRYKATEENIEALLGEIYESVIVRMHNALSGT